MALLREKDKQHLRKQFESLTGPVKLVVFTQEMECEYCGQTREIAEEVAGLTDKISVEIYDFVADKEKVEAYGIDKIPAMAIVGKKDYGIRYYGIPSGYEFSSVIEDIMMVSKGQSGLSDATKKAVAGLKTPVHIQVFVTPTCPYCPQAVHLAHQLAIESDLIRGDMVEAIEFPHLSQKYNVMGVPRTVINENIHVEGAVPEAMLIPEMLKALKEPAGVH